MSRSTHAPAFSALTSRGLRAAILGTSLLSLACSPQHAAPLNPTDFSLGDFEASFNLVSTAASGLIPNTPQLVRLATDTTLCLAVDELTKPGASVFVANCGDNPRQLFKFTSAGEVRTSANACIGAFAEQPKIGTPIAVTPCGKPASQWTYDAAKRLANSTGACFTVKGQSLTAAAKAQLGTCVSPAPWSQKLLWVTPGAPTPTPPPSPTIKSVRVSPATNTIVKGDSIRLTPTAYNATGQPVPAVFTWSVASGGSLASVSQGLVKGLNVGTATIAAQTAGFTGTATVTVTAIPVPPPIPIPPPGPAPSIPPTLPLSTVNVGWRAPTGQTINVRAGDNLQNAINQARRGDEIVIQAGATFTGNFVLPAKVGTPANGWITIRTSALSSLPPLGTRINPARDAGFMPKIITHNTVSAIRTDPSASGWRLVGLDVTVSPQVTAQHTWGLIALGDGNRTKQKALATVPHDLILDRVYVHAQPTTQITRCVALNSALTAIVDSYLAECHGSSFDSQAIGGWNGPGPYLIENNRLEAAGENIMFGGASPGIQNLTPSDITIRRNFITRPIAWKGVWQVKNLFELKNTQRVLVEANVFENHWPDAQSGPAIVIGSANQLPGSLCPWCIVADVTFRWNHVNNVSAVFNIFATQTNAQPTRRVSIHNNLFTNVGIGYPTIARVFMLSSDVHDLWIEHNTGSAPYGYVYLSGQVKQRFTFRDNVGGGAQYNWFSSQGQGNKANAAHLVAPFLVNGNCFAGGSTAIPSGSLYAPTLGGLPAACASAGVNQTQLTAKLAGVR